jgi:mxaJ protein
MCSRFPKALALATLVIATAAPVRAEEHPTVLRVCADPNNLPFSNDHEEGFENRIVRLIATELGADVRYTWWAQHRGFIRNTLNAGVCDLVAGVPLDYELALTTPPYYRSSYVAVSRPDLHVDTLDDPALRALRIGVQMIGDDFANSPPAHALSARGLVRNVVGYSVLGDYRQPNPPALIVSAVAAGDVDAALVWGPLAGYFATRQTVPLTLSPVTPESDSPARRFAFAIAMGTRRDDTARLRELDSFIQRRRAEIDRVLAEFGVPRVEPAKAGANP